LVIFGVNMDRKSKPEKHSMAQWLNYRLREQQVEISAGREALLGDLTIPVNTRGLVLFAHGSGSSRLSPRNRHVAQVLNEAGLATLLFDLLTPREEQIDRMTREYRFNIGLLADRLAGATDWAIEYPDTQGLNIGYFGASTGAAAALIAAAQHPKQVDAVVSRGGRSDLAGPALGQVCAPVLLIVGGDDHEVIYLNQQALEQLRCEKALFIIPGASHLFEEPGKLDEAAKAARDWFIRYLNGEPIPHEPTIR
jgi:putative phosphoribosyl transferase